MEMASPRCSILETLTVLLLAWVMIHCQAPLKAEEEEDTNTARIDLNSELMECPSECSCTFDWAVDCAGVDLTEFPSGLSENTRQLSLQVSNIPHT